MFNVHTELANTNSYSTISSQENNERSSINAYCQLCRAVSGNQTAADTSDLLSPSKSYASASYNNESMQP